MSSSSSSQASNEPSAVHLALTKGRKDLWRYQLPPWLNPVREFLIDPSLQFWIVVLPPLATMWKVDAPMAKFVNAASLTPMIWTLGLFASPSNVQQSARSVARNDLLHASPPLHFRPPSDMASAVRGGFAFVFSVAADIIGAFLDPGKMRKWWEAVSQFRTYLHQSGVGAELEESMVKPLWRGRLLDNIKILNDIQEIQDADRGERASDSAVDLTKELEEGCRMMRFATAAYGTEMIRSAIDREVNHEDLEDEMKAISFHTLVQPEDVKLLRVQQGGNMAVLRHFVALDHASKSVVLALRGTLSISGALVDMQAMDCEYCTGRAHKGIAEQADHIWEASGDRIQEILGENPDYRLAVVGHSLGAGAACLLHIKIYTENLLPNKKVFCYGFAPPPTFSVCGERSEAIDHAIQNCVCYVHDNDCVPLLSVASIRRLSDLMDAVDNKTEHLWFWQRFRMFWEWEAIPQDIVDAVSNLTHNKERTLGECEMVIPARVIVWMKKNHTGKFEALACQPKAMAELNVFMCEDMVCDHLPEQYEDALDILNIPPS